MRKADSFKDDLGLMNAKMAILATKHTAKILSKYGKITPKLPITVPHILAYGPAGSGKTTRIEAVAELMGCTEQDNTFIRINSDCIENIDNLIELLDTKLSWQGYSKDANGNILDPNNPVAPIKQVLVFLDEVHCLSKTTQEKLGLIMLDFRYQVKTNQGIKTIYFPKFTLAAATTKPGDLIKPLRTRFGIKINVGYGTDSDMLQVLNTMLVPTGWNISGNAKKIIASMSQGIPREVGNHLTGLYNCWIHSLYTGQTTEKQCIIEDIARKYAKAQKYTLDGISYDQVRVLKFLSQFRESGKKGGAGVVKICSALDLDPEQFLDTLEPRLVYRRFMISGTRGREITDLGLSYLEKVLSEYKDIPSV
jgi:Holliday junction resolvasome RuvABC ATP-dependent DNA helicase subunit